MIVLLQAFANLSEKLEPLVEGVRQNKQKWLEKAGVTEDIHDDSGEQ